MIKQYIATSSYASKDKRYTAALLHGPYFESAIILDDGCKSNHHTHEAATNCAMRLAVRGGYTSVARLEDSVLAE